MSAHPEPVEGCGLRGLCVQGDSMNAQRVIADLRELAARTSTPDGAQRLAWGPVWRDAREGFKGTVAELGLRIETDSAGNNWGTLPRPSPATVTIPTHLHSRPNPARP